MIVSNTIKLSVYILMFIVAGLLVWLEQRKIKKMVK